MWPRRTGWTIVGLLLLVTACGVAMEPEHPELTSGEFEGWDWSLAGETVDAEDEVCIELLVSPGGGSVHGGPACHAVPPGDGVDVRSGRAGSGDEEIADVRGVVGSGVAEVRLSPGYGDDAETVFIKESPTGPGWFAFLYDPQEGDPPAELILLDEDGNQLGQRDLSPFE